MHTYFKTCIQSVVNTLNLSLIPNDYMVFTQATYEEGVSQKQL